MIRRPPRSTRTDTLFPYTTLFRSLKAQITRAPGLDDFSADFRNASAISATPARSLRRPEDFVTSRGADAARAKPPGYRTATFRVRAMDGRFFAERDSISAVAEA